MDPKKMKARMKAIQARAQALATKAELTPEESDEIKALASELASIQARLTALAIGETEMEEEAAAEDPAPTEEEPEPTPSANNRDRVRAAIQGGDKPGASKKSGGFSHVGEFAVALATASTRNGKIDPRLLALGGGNTQVPREGGYAVPTEFASEILELMKGTNGIAQFCAQLKTGGGDFEQSIDPNEPWSTSGIQVGYLDELGAMTVNKPDLELVSIKLAETGALVKLSNRLMKDAPMVASLVRRNVPARLNSFITKQILRGDAVGRHFSGFLSSSAKKTITAEASQGANTIKAENVVKMMAALPSDQMGSFVWLVHPTALPQIWLLKDSSGNPMYQPLGGLRDSPWGTLLGRPVVVCEHCSVLGTEGDIIAFAGEGYGLLTRTGTSPTLEESMHCYFDSNSYALRFTLDAGGGPLWPSTGAYPDGSTFSPFVTLSSTRT